VSLPKGATFQSKSVHLAAQSTEQMAGQRIRTMELRRLIQLKQSGMSNRKIGEAGYEPQHGERLC